MTLADVLRALLRRWPIVLIGLLVTGAVAVLGTKATPVYHARTEMVLLAPASARYPNELVTQTESLIVTAGAVATRINGADVQPKYGSPIVNPIGAPGNGQSTWIKLLDTGTQWVANFDDQILVIDAVGDTPEEVAERIDAAATRVDEELLALQQDQGVDPTAYVTARMSPVQPVIAEVTGSRVRAVGMTVAVGGFLTVALAVVLEVRARRIRAQTADRWSALLATITGSPRR